MQEFYRYSDPDYHEGEQTDPWLAVFVSYKKTPKGNWVLPRHYDYLANTKYNKAELKKRSKFILDTSNKKYAYPTKELALGSYIYRKQRQIPILTHQLENAKMFLEWALEMQERENQQRDAEASELAQGDLSL